MGIVEKLRRQAKQAQRSTAQHSASHDSLMANLQEVYRWLLTRCGGGVGISFTLHGVDLMCVWCGSGGERGGGCRRAGGCGGGGGISILLRYNGRLGFRFGRFGSCRWRGVGSRSTTTLTSTTIGRSLSRRCRSYAIRCYFTRAVRSRGGWRGGGGGGGWGGGGCWRGGWAVLSGFNLLFPGRGAHLFLLVNGLQGDLELWPQMAAAIHRAVCGFRQIQVYLKMGASGYLVRRLKYGSNMAQIWLKYGVLSYNGIKLHIIDWL